MRSRVVSFPAFVLLGNFRLAAAGTQAVFELMELIDAKPHVRGAGDGAGGGGGFVGGHESTIVSPYGGNAGSGRTYGVQSFQRRTRTSGVSCPKALNN
jgi:hypothetical protein